MTAINIWRNKDKAILMTDGAGYTADLVVQTFYPKCATIPHLGAAVAVRGSMLLPVHMAQHLGQGLTSFDELIEELGERARAAFEEALPHLEVHGLTDMDLFLVGWSEKKDETVALMISSADHPEEDMVAWQVSAVEDIGFAPMPNVDLAVKAIPDVFTTKDFIPETHGVQLMELQRREKIRPWLFGSESGEDAGSIVGGFALSTEVTKNGVSQRVVHRWNDKVGEKIKPDTDAIPSIGNRPGTFKPARQATPPAAAGMSRKERRAEAAKTRKGAA